MPNTYVISDIHGCCRTFKFLLEEVIQFSKQDTLYLLGDYIDRGPDSKGVLDHIIFLQENNYKVFPLRGNHEELMLNAYQKLASHEKTWLMNGGDTTLESFGITRTPSILPKYISFCAALPHYIELEQYILVHAGLNFERDQPFEDEHAMLWIRHYVIDPVKIDHKIIVHGHTPMPMEVVETSVANAEKKYRIFLDNGCVYKKTRENLGNLCCLRLEDRKLFTCSNID